MIDPQYSQLIISALSSEKNVRESAEKALSELAVDNPPKFLFSLASELADEGKSTHSRQMAAALMKNFITINEKTKQIWMNLENNSKDQIKNLILSTLASQDKSVRKAAGLVIAAICKVDLPLTEKWPNLISSLCSNSYNENLNIRHAAIESLGYMCEELNNKSIDAVSVDSILTALIKNITEKQVNDDILFTALNAFLHCLPLAEKNFSKPNELEIIMNALFDVCGNNMSKDFILEKVSQILIDICEIYYDYIGNFILKIGEYAFWVVSEIFNFNFQIFKFFFCFLHKLKL
jgi:importin subunit beta-1